MTGRRSLLLLFLMACGQVLKPPEPNRRLNVHTSGTMFVSDVGYKFAALPEEDAHVIRVDVRYPVGSMDDPPGKEGLAHLVEHMLFDVEIPRGDAKTSISAELGSIALWWNAYTEKDHTTFQVLAAPEQLDALMALEVERLAIGCGGLTPAILQREREVVLNELRQRQGASGAAIQQMINNDIYPDSHPYRPVDTIESVEKIGFGDVCAFLATAYQRGEAAVVVSGAVDGNSLQAAAGHFGKLRKRSLQARHHVPVVQPKPGLTKMRADLDEPVLIATWPLPALSSKEYHLLEIGIPYVESELSMWGFVWGVGHSVDSWIIGGDDVPMLAVSITLTGTDKLDDGIDWIKKAAANAVGHVTSDDKESPKWLHQWQWQAESLLAQYESLSGRNEMFGQFLADSDKSFLVGRVDELAKAAPGEARSLVKEWLSPGRAHFILLEPSGTSRLHGKTYTKAGAEAHATEVDPALADVALDVPALPLHIDVERYKLDNGLSVVLWPHGRSSVVQGRLVIGSGTAQDPQGAEGVSQLVRGDRVGADSIVYSDRSLSMRVDELVHDLGSELRWPGYEISDEQKKFLRGRLRAKRAKERSKYERDLLSAVYGAKHPYARIGMTEDSVDAIGTDVLMGWARSNIVPKNATLILAGEFDASVIKKHIAYNVDQVSSGSTPRSVESAPAGNKQSQWIHGVTDKPSPTVEITVSFAGGDGLDRNYAKRLVLEQVLDDQLSSLRGKHAVTYGFYASYEPRKAGGLWRIGGDADGSRAAEAGAAVAQILADMRKDPESYRASFVLARQKVLESMLVGATDSNAIANHLVEMARFDVSETFYDVLVTQVAKLKLADFSGFVGAELPIESQVFGAFGNKAAVDQAIEAAQKIER